MTGAASGETRGRGLHKRSARAAPTKLRLLRFARGAAAVFLRFLQKVDLLLEKLIFQVLPGRLEVHQPLQLRLADVAIVQAPFDQQTWFCRRGDLTADLVQKPLLHKVLVHLLKGRLPEGHWDRLPESAEGWPLRPESAQRPGEQRSRGGAGPLFDGDAFERPLRHIEAIRPRRQHRGRAHGDFRRGLGRVQHDSRGRDGIVHPAVDPDDFKLHGLALVDSIKKEGQGVTVVGFEKVREADSYWSSDSPC